MSHSSETCHACGGNTVLVSGPRRFHMYRGVRCELPHDMKVRTCVFCSAQWMNDDELSVLSESFEAQRIAVVRLKK